MGASARTHIANHQPQFHSRKASCQILLYLNEGSSGLAVPNTKLPLFLGKFIRAGSSERKTSPVFRGGGPEDRRGVLFFRTFAAQNKLQAI
jgi:hypothetical protein